MTPPIPYKLIASLVGGLLAMAALSWLIGSRNHWKETAAANEQLYHGEQTAHQLTVANYRAKAVEAHKADEANVARVVAEQTAINERSSSEYEARIADARARYERLQPRAGSAPANPGRSGNPDLSNVSQAPSGTPGPAAQGQLSTDDALTATEQAIQLDELIKAVTAHSNVNVNGTDEHPSK